MNNRNEKIRKIIEDEFGALVPDECRANYLIDVRFCTLDKTSDDPFGTYVITISVFARPRIPGSHNPNPYKMFQHHIPYEIIENMLKDTSSEKTMQMVEIACGARKQMNQDAGEPKLNNFGKDVCKRLWYKLDSQLKQHETFRCFPHCSYYDICCLQCKYYRCLGITDGVRDVFIGSKLDKND